MRACSTWVDATLVPIRRCTGERIKSKQPRTVCLLFSQPFADLWDIGLRFGVRLRLAIRARLATKRRRNSFKAARPAQSRKMAERSAPHQLKPTSQLCRINGVRRRISSVLIIVSVASLCRRSTMRREAQVKAENIA